MKIISLNRKATHNYEILDKFEAGIVLKGDEVKSLRQGSVSMGDSFGVVKDGEIFLLNCYIAPYSHAYEKKDDSRRSRKLLFKRREINRLVGEISRKGLTLVPLKIYFGNRGKVKIEMGLAKHKKLINKKRELKERDISRQASREVKMHIK
ncbi:SsrA-binding protein SmpB [Candidatus Babeliales bacterium]|nr:SsrA-binding protein SmpB [Candidatus Babeliales bacterium]